MCVCACVCVCVCARARVRLLLPDVCGDQQVLRGDELRQLLQTADKTDLPAELLTAKEHNTTQQVRQLYSQSPSAQ